MTHHTRHRVATIALAPAAAVIGWATIRLAGIDLVLKDGTTVGPVDVFAAALLGAMGGWLVVRLLERHARNPRAWWGFLGSTGFAISTIGPTWLAAGVTGVCLIALHAFTAIVVITGFAGTLPCRGCVRTRRPEGRAESNPAR